MKDSGLERKALFKADIATQFEYDDEVGPCTHDLSECVHTSHAQENSGVRNEQTWVTAHQYAVFPHPACLPKKNEKTEIEH